MSTSQPKIPIAYDLASQNAMGGSSDVPKLDYVAYLKDLLPNPNSQTQINIMVLPDCSPNVGTICSLALAFVIAQNLRKLGVNVIVCCNFRDRAKGEQISIDGTKYQRSLQNIDNFLKYGSEYYEILNSLSARYGIKYKAQMEEDFLKYPEMPGVIRDIIKDRTRLAKHFAPSTGFLAIRAACPVCDLVDKHGVHNIYDVDASTVSFRCPFHLRFSCNIATESHRFQFNRKLLNLVMGLFHERVSYNSIEICSSEYAGFRQEQLLWRFLSKPAVIVYTPMIHDWAGSSLPKPLVLKSTSYDYLRKAEMGYLLSYRDLQDEGKDISILWREVERWVNEPYRLFRSYSLHYLHLLFDNEEVAVKMVQQTQVAETG